MQLNSRLIISLMLGLWVLTTAAAIVGAQETAAATQLLAGKGEWQSLSGDSIQGTWNVTLTRRGGHVEGNLDLTGSNVFSGGTVSGEIDDSSVVLGVMVDGTQAASFSGKLDGNAVSGEWNCDLAKDMGAWIGTLAAARVGSGTAATQE